MTTNTSRKWDAQKLGDLVSFRTGKLNSNAAVANGDYPFFTCSQETYKTNTFSFDTECVLLAGNNANGVYPLKFFSGKFDAYQRTYIIEALDRNVLLNKFLYYALRPKLSEFQNISTGVSTKFLTLTLLKQIGIDIPDSLTQKQIANTLSAYDDLIENNNRRIKILEETAQKIYTEWFANFRFPGHEKVKMVDSGTKLGMIPEGWEVHHLDDCLIVHRGKSYTSEELVDEGGLPFINLKCVNRYGGFRKDGIKRFSGKYKDTQMVTMGDIVMAVTDMTQERMIVARCARVPSLENGFGVISMDLVKIEPRDNCEKNFLYSFFRWSEFADEVKNHANGANVLHLNPQRVSDYEFLLPAHGLQKAFSQSIEPMFSEIDSIQLVNENLKKTRDLLIPQLVSGKLEIK